MKVDGSGTGELAVPVAEKVTGPFPWVEEPKVPMVLSKPGAVKSAVPPNTVTGTPPITRFVAVMLSIVVVREPTVNEEQQEYGSR